MSLITRAAEAVSRVLNSAKGDGDDMTESGATEIWDSRYAAESTAVARTDSAGDAVDYMTHPFLWRQAVARRLTGSTDGDPSLDFCLKHLQPPAQKMLAIGSGLATLEQWVVECGFAEHCIAYEASQSAVDKASQRIREAGLEGRLEMRCGDVRESGIPDGTFDLVMVQAAIHHFFEIEDMFALMHRVLKPGGILMFDEYIGPDHLQFSDADLAIMDEIFACLDERYRVDNRTGQPRDGILKPTLQQMLDMDPSEGVHATRILPLTYRYFEVVDRRDYGGTILRPFFSGILQNFNFDDPRDQTIGRMIVLLEDVLLREGRIGHAHTRLVARRRDVPLPPLEGADAERINYADWAGMRPATGQAG